MLINRLNNQTMSPLSISHIMRYLRAPEEESGLVTQIANRAANMMYTYTAGRVLNRTSFDVYYDTADITDPQVLALPVRPLLSVASVSYFDLLNAETVLDPSKYTWIVGDHNIYMTDSAVIPVRANRAVKVSFDAGYQDPPTDLLLGLDQLIVYLYENRGDTTNMIPDSVRMTLDPYVIWRL